MSALDDDELFDALNKSPLIGAVNTFEMKVGDHPAAGIEWTVRRGGKALTTRLVVVFLGKGRVYNFVFEAPRKGFKRAKTTLDAVIGTARFDIAAVPSLRNPFLPR